ncbi:hypothetical protein MTF66_19765 [Pseudoalteromonas sp. 2CM39R]|jgi:flagellar basal body-associated protein FliL|uniref:hypothetical protein n=1 Tax=Pseudoalteromonas TaxID=53246 RepID=UPI000825D8C3|nr:MULTISPECIES: hypothetical protein [Pseudoalteromonas]MCK8124633.1 hypothetical protein [Pseudoalteromonas sp. 2CM39R]MCK8127260.1 hypothetical protein [Pseudoalteromonas sp. 2CM39R]
MTLTNWILVIIGIVSLILTVVIPIIVYLFSSNAATRQELAQHKTHVAEYYATKDDVKDLGDRMERQMKQGFEQLKELLNSRNTA